MELLEQCQIWHENDEHQKIIDALEDIPAGERTPEMDSELARAYNNLADYTKPEGRELLKKALALLKPHEEYFEGDHYWNFRMGYSYFYLDQEGRALRYFEKALKARPDDEDTKQFIEWCKKGISLPQFSACFRERTEGWWETFAEMEAELRQRMDEDKDHTRGAELVAQMEETLNLVFDEISFEMGFNGEKYELILTPEGDKVKLFELVYFQKHAPREVLEHWNILVGRQPSRNIGLRTDDGWNISGEDVQIWLEEQGENSFVLSAYCEKLLPMLREAEGRAWWMLTTLTDQVLGEIPHMRYIDNFDVLEEPRAEPSFLLSQLPDKLKERGLDLSCDPEGYLESYLSYKLEPNEDPEADWRLDTMVGSTCCAPLVNGYLDADNDFMDELHADGAAAGFFCYPLDTLREEEGTEKLFDFRDRLEEALAAGDGPEILTLTGGATGLFCGYVDFIAWDIRAVLQKAKEFFEGTDIPWANFHTFRREAGTVALKHPPEGEPQVDPETGSLLSAADIQTLEGFCGDTAGYFGKMYGYLMELMEKGVSEGRFTVRQARRDLQIALWYAYACNNLDEYTMYYRAAQWMPDSEENAKGCGMWYYRYSCALLYCGRLEEALRYAEQGVREEPDYPWGWLQLGKLCSHFGDRAGALEAVDRGLALVPEDYEFLTLRQEIQDGATLEEMEYHWIDPGCDRRLQAGLDPDADDKQRAISCITVNGAGLQRFMALFRPDPAAYEKDDPYCSFPCAVQGQKVELVFRMNEAGLSKLNGDWLRAQKERLDSGFWSTCPGPGTGDGTLETALFDLDYSVTLIYRLPGGEDLTFQVRAGEDGAPDRASMVLLKDGEPVGPAECYSQEEMEAVEEHIAAHFGPVENVFHELVSPDIHVDICVVEPSADRDYYTLVTMGMGARRMKVPEELAEYHLERAEVAIALPPDWRLDAESLKDERWYWPIGLLKVLARLPLTNDTWLGWGHTLGKESPFAETTDLCAAILISPQDAEEGAEVCTLPNGEEVNFYQVIPLYQDELDFKQRRGAEELLARMEDVSFIVDPARPSAMEGEENEEDGAWVLDNGAWHLESIRDKELPVDELCAYNHMAIYLRWCMEQDLMSLEFLERCWDTAEAFNADPAGTDLRPFIRDELGGQLFSALFDEEGEAFARYYYDQLRGSGAQFPGDVDDYALRYFGPERYHSDEFRDEAYLFVPFDEDYYQAMAQTLEQRFRAWQGQGA